MCLKIDNQLTAEYKGKTEPIYAYKVLIARITGHYSPYQSAIWVGGKNVSSRTLPDISDVENASESVREGFHFCLDMDSVEEFLLKSFGIFRLFHPFVVFKVKIDPKNIVAVGYFKKESELTFKKCRNIVATEAELLEEVPREGRKSCA